MAITLILHIKEEANAVLLDVEELPNPDDQILIGNNPRYRDGKELHNVQPEVNTLIYPWWRINFIEVLPSKEDEEIFGFYRD